MSQLSKEIKRLKNLRNYKDKSDSAIEHIAQISLWKRQIDIESRFTETDEKKLASQLFNNYIENYTFQSFEQITRLADLTYNEIILKRIRDDINKISADKNNVYISDKLIGSLHSVEAHINNLKVDLGIVKKDNIKDDLTALQELQKKMKVKIAFERNEFELEVPFICKKCGHEDVAMYLLRRRCNKENFEVLKHPYFSGRFLFSVEIINAVEDGTITKELAATFLHTSPKYVEWAILNRHKIVEIEGVSKEDVNDFINKNPFLPPASECNEK